MPGANELALQTNTPEQLALRATFGLLQSFDEGRSWSWICEKAIETSGVIADPPFGVVEDGSLVLLPPTGGILTSHDHGCSWAQALDSVTQQRGADLTVDPSDPKRLLVLMSTTERVDELGYGIIKNAIIETRDSAHSWRTLATLPSDVEAETIEVAKSDPRRMYVSGTLSTDPRMGVLLRSEDGGQSWTRTTMMLPAGTGSLLISAIHPRDPDRLWLRVPVRGDTLGLFAARLFVSTDKGKTARMLALTRTAMLGFALSPDGEKVAYGAPADGLFVGPSDGSGTFEKRNSVAVRCLRWRVDGALFACGTEPLDAFSLAISRDEGRTFEGLYSLKDTCPATCADANAYASACREPWTTSTRVAVGAVANMCTVPWASEGNGPDAGVAREERDAALASDAGPSGEPPPRTGESRDATLPQAMLGDAGAKATGTANPPSRASADGSGCSALPTDRAPPPLLLLVLSFLILRRAGARQKREREYANET